MRKRHANAQAKRAVVFATAILGLLVWRLPALAQQPLGDQFRVNTYTSDEQDWPDVAADQAGNYVVVWHSALQLGGDFGVYAKRFSRSGAELTSEFRVSSDASSPQYFPRVDGNGSGGFVVVWGGAATSDSFGVSARRFGNGGAPIGSTFRVNTTTVNYQYNPTVAVAQNGSFVIVWTSPDGPYPNYGVFGQRFDGSGSPLAPQFRVNELTTNDQTVPDVSSDPAGNTVVVWSEFDGGGSGIRGRRFSSSGEALGGTFRVNTATTFGEQDYPIVASFPSGGFIVTWSGYNVDGSGAAVVGRRYDAAGAPQTGEFRINTTTTGRQGSGNVDTEPGGGFVVVWSSVVGSDQRELFGQRFTPAGAPAGPEFPIASSSTGNQTVPVVATDGTGHFTVVWSDQFAEGSGYGIFARRFQGGANGDANGDGAVTVSDILYLINHLFAGGPAPAGAADVNADGALNVSDVLYLINFLFAGGPAPL